MTKATTRAEKLPKATPEMAIAFYAEIARQRETHGWPAHDICFEGLPEIEQKAILASFDAAISVLAKGRQ